MKSELDRPNPQLVARSVRIFWLLLKIDAVASDPHTDIVAGATLSGSAVHRHCPGDLIMLHSLDAGILWINIGDELMRG